MGGRKEDKVKHEAAAAEAAAWDAVLEQVTKISEKMESVDQSDNADVAYLPAAEEPHRACHRHARRDGASSASQEGELAVDGFEVGRDRVHHLDKRCVLHAVELSELVRRELLHVRVPVERAPRAARLHAHAWALALPHHDGGSAALDDLADACRHLADLVVTARGAVGGGDAEQREP